MNPKKQFKAFPSRKAYRITDRAEITPTMRKEAARLGSQTTQKNAARVFGVSFASVRNWMLALGYETRGLTGAPRLEEVTRWQKNGAAYVGPDCSRAVKPGKFKR
jgi:hypothetical protein